jgi:hypothetical protein
MRRVHTALFVVGLLLVAARDREVRADAARPLQLDFLFEHRFGADLNALQRHAAWLSEYDLLVALHLEHVSARSLDEIIAWRREGSSWDAITRRCGLGSETYRLTLPTSLALRGPYARPYATWRQNSRADLRLTDEEVRELVLLRTLRDHCRLTAEDIVRRRTRRARAASPLPGRTDAGARRIDVALPARAAESRA